MDSYQDTYLNKRPQDLCHMCGKCCRVVTTPTPYNDLLKLKENNDQGASDFLSVFEPIESIEKAKELDADTVNNIIKSESENKGVSADEITFYTCKYLQKNNLCGNYENRPKLCIHCPSTPWVVVPPGCGFEGWLFLKREEIKEKIRKHKEELLDLNALQSKISNPETLKKIKLVESKINDTIAFYDKYGSKDW